MTRSVTAAQPVSPPAAASVLRFSAAASVDIFDPQALAKQLSEAAPRYNWDFMPNIWYPVCNESGWAKTYQFLDSQPVLRAQNNVALLFGESNFISLLPLLVKMGITLVCMSDREEAVHRNNAHMLDVFNMSDDITSFRKNFNPVTRYGMSPILEQLTGCAFIEHLGKYHFLSDENRYQACKKALSNITVCHLSFDLRNEKSCDRIAQIIKGAGAQISLLNVSNIVMDSDLYDCDHKTWRSLPLLLQYSQDATILYSDWHLKSERAQGWDQFRSIMLGDTVTYKM